MIRVLFICLGNICRSPMAEAIFRRKVEDAGLKEKIQVDSTGTEGWHFGKPPHEGTQRVLQANGIDFTGIKARQANREDFHHFDYLVSMDASNADHMLAIAPSNHNAILKKLMDFVPEHVGSDVPDPYYSGNFEEVFAMIDQGCEYLLAYIREKEGL